MVNAKSMAKYPRMLRRALDFIDGNAEYDITIRDIAAAADVTPAPSSTRFASTCRPRRWSTCVAFA